jgi:hypothetical protein
MACVQVALLCATCVSVCRVVCAEWQMYVIFSQLRAVWGNIQALWSERIVRPDCSRECFACPISVHQRVLVGVFIALVSSGLRSTVVTVAGADAEPRRQHELCHLLEHARTSH